MERRRTLTETPSLGGILLSKSLENFSLSISADLVFCPGLQSFSALQPIFNSLDIFFPVFAYLVFPPSVCSFANPFWAAAIIGETSFRMGKILYTHICPKTGPLMCP